MPHPNIVMTPELPHSQDQKAYLQHRMIAMNTSSSFNQNLSPNGTQTFSIETNSNQIVKNVIANANKGADFYLNQGKYSIKSSNMDKKIPFARSETKNS